MRRFIIISFVLLAIGGTSFTQDNAESFIVELKANGLPRTELSVLKLKDSIYLPLKETFNTLGIVITYDTLKNTLSGFYKREDSVYTINFSDNIAKRGRRRVPLQGTEFYTYEGQSYLSMDFINRFFDLDFKFNQRVLRITVTRTTDLPIVIEKRRLRLLSRRRAATIPEPEMYLPTEISPLNGGRIGWQSTEHFGKLIYPRSRQVFDMGFKTFGMDYNADWVYDARRNKTTSTYLHSLRIPLFTNSYVRQITFGDFTNYNLIAQTLRGLQFTNRPAALRRVFTQDIFQGVVEPGMNVTINNTAADVLSQVADNEGRYNYNIPVLYGNGIMEIQAFDMWGREKTFRYRMSVPRSMIPPGETEYFLSVGKVRNRHFSAFSGSFDYGVSSEFTVGTKMLGYDFKYSDKFFPAITNTILLSRGVVLSDYIAPNALSRADLSWEFPSSALISLSAVKYSNNRYFNPANISHEFEGTVTLPILRNNNVYTFNAYGSSTRYKSFRTDEYQISMVAMYRTISPAMGFRFVEERQDGDGIPTLIKQTNASVNITLPAGVNLLFTGVYDHLAHGMNELQGTVLKSISPMFKFSLSYMRFYPVKSYSIQFNLFAYLPFLRSHGSVASSHAGRYEYNVVSSGTVFFDLMNPSLMFMNDRATAISSGGFYLRPYLDTNNNSRRDKGEPFMENGRMRVRNASFKSNILSLQANKPYRQGISNYEVYDIYLDPKSLDDPILVPAQGVMQVQAQPNYLRRIDIPVVTGGVVHGVVQMVQKDTLTPMEGITLVLRSVKTEKDTAKFTRSGETFSTGEYEFIGIPPGEYFLSIDKNQLEQLKATAAPLMERITISVKPEGDMVEGKNFKLYAR
jgi:hypothetical protein